MFNRTEIRVLVCSFLVISLIFCSNVMAKKKKDIDVKGIKSVAVAPFEYTKFRYFSEKSGDIVPENMMEILAKKCKWQTTDL